MSGAWLLDVGYEQDTQGLEWEAASNSGASRAELDLSSWVTWGESLTCPELPAPRGPAEAPLAKSLTNAFPSLHAVGISGVWGLPSIQIRTLATAAEALAQEGWAGIPSPLPSLPQPPRS